VTWCIVEDFNVSLHFDERLGGAAYRSEVFDFTDFVAEQGLMDLPLVGGESTWSNNSSWSKLDHFLVNFSYPGLIQKKLLRVCSDHVPILLDGGYL
jgi:endonuclease/exonuclease/phosphatase family metal-dependent hydrolase